VIVAIHQPHYMPWLRYLHKIASCEVFVVLDDAAFTKNGWQNRNKIKASTGWMYLTVPVRVSLGQPIKEVEIAGGQWRSKHLRAIEQNYARAPYFHRYMPGICEILGRDWARLSELNDSLLSYLLAEIGIHTPLIWSSDLGVSGVATERLVNICNAVGATTYLSGEYAAQAYLEPELFQSAGIELAYQKWHCPAYRQQHPKDGFIPDLSILDLLLNEGPRTLEILRQGAQSEVETPS